MPFLVDCDYITARRDGKRQAQAPRVFDRGFRQQAANGATGKIRLVAFLESAILDEALICHVGFADGAQPYVTPMIHIREADTLYFHGARHNRLLTKMAGGRPICAEATIIDALALGRSVINNSMNYRSVVLFGHGEDIADAERKRAVADLLIERIIAGRRPGLRDLPPTELRKTRVIAVRMNELSVKVRTGDAGDDQDDLNSPIWAGEIPLRIGAGTAIADRHVPEGIPVPDHVARWDPVMRGGSGSP